jgi:DNA-binding transcriptional LysR family regulator
LMEIIQLVSFYQIVKTGSFSKASSMVFRSQSAISHQIANLEKELQVRLFDRIGKKIKLTDEGKILFSVVDDFFNDLDRLKRIYMDMHTGKGSRLAIASGGTLITNYFPSIIKTFMVKCVGSKVKLIDCGLTSQLISKVSDGEVDFGIGPNMNYTQPPNMHFLSWKTFDLVLVMAKGHPLCSQREINISDIAKYPLILFREETVVRRIIEEAFIKNKLDHKIIIEMDGAENIKQYVEIGIGISILSSLTLTQKDRDRLSLSVVSNLFGHITYGIYFRKDKYITTAMKQFVECFDSGLLDGMMCLQNDQY